MRFILPGMVGPRAVPAETRLWTGRMESRKEGQVVGLASP
jgi:hypothetical protein